jgi:transposase InsO family protein
LLIERIALMGLSDAAEAAGISTRTARKWQARFHCQGEAGLMDRSSRPQRTRSRLDAPALERIEGLRRQRMPMRRIAGVVGRSVATISRALAIDDHSRAGFVQVLRDERKESAAAFLQAAVAHYAALGVKIERLLTDNGSAYRSRLFKKTCEGLGIKHTYTRPYRPQTNGKAERFIQTCLREWAYVRSYDSSKERTTVLPSFLSYYNARRPHSALGYRPPASRLAGNNLLQLDT